MPRSLVCTGTDQYRRGWAMVPLLTDGAGLNVSIRECLLLF
jgi:hypothetical protein